MVVDTRSSRTTTPAVRALVDYQRAWQAELAGVALVACTGPASSVDAASVWTEAFIVQEEMRSRHAPRSSTEWQSIWSGRRCSSTAPLSNRRRYLHRIVNAEDLWCQLFSEPEAGPTSGPCRPRDSGDGRLAGEWAEGLVQHAQYSRYGVLLARTADAERAATPIGYFLLDMITGHRRASVAQMTGESDFNEVFLDGRIRGRRGGVGDPAKDGP